MLDILTEPESAAAGARADMPFETVAGPADRGLLLIADHASNAIPPEYGALGIPASELERHIAYDIGSAALTRALAARLGAPAVLSTFSRLLIDPNRGADDPTLVMRLSDGVVLPGNARIDEAEKARRIARFYAPYHGAIEAAVDAGIAAGRVPVVFSIHSFTPVWRGWPRPWHAGILWDEDPRFAVPLIERLREDPALVIGDNEPYSGALKNDTLYRHCTRRGIAHALIEVRQDLIADAEGVDAWADRLAPIVSDLLSSVPDLHELMEYGSRTD